MGDSPQYSSSMANPIPLHPSLGGSKARCQVPHRRSPSCAVPLVAPFSPTLVGDTRADRGGRVTFTFIGRRSERRQGYIEVVDSGVTIHACPCLARSASRVSYSQQQTALGEDAFVHVAISQVQRSGQMLSQGRFRKFFKRGAIKLCHELHSCKK